MSHLQTGIKRLTVRLVEILRRWKWALLYACLILAILPVTPVLLRSSKDLSLPPYVGASLPALGVGAWALLMAYALTVRSDNRLLRAILLVFIGSVYGVMLTFFIHFPVERLHLAEYGLLGGLTWRATSGKAFPLLRGWRMAAFLAATSLFDEGLQGVIDGRYYDIRDFFVNLLAGGLGAAILSLAGRGHSAGKETVGSPLQRIGGAADLIAFGVLAAVAFGVAAVGHPPWDDDVLAGSWERKGECGVAEQVTFEGGGSFTWRDGAGNHARGRYTLRGNRLDGPLLELVCTGAENRSECGFQKGFAASVYITIEGDRFFFNVAPSHPFISISSSKL